MTQLDKDGGLIAFMESLGYEYHDGEYYKCFVKDEGTCELTFKGAEDLMRVITSQVSARIEAEHVRGVEIGMGRAKTAITVAMNTGSTTMQELRAVLDKELEWWQNNMYPTTFHKQSKESEQ